MKNSYLFFRLLVFLFFISCGSVFGQQTQSSSDHLIHYRQGKSFFEARNYLAAQEAFRTYLYGLTEMNAEMLSEKTSAEYLLCMCSIYSMRPEAEVLANRFVENYPKNPYSADLVRDLGIYFYEAGDWKRAIKYLSKGSLTNIEFKFKLAVAYYQIGQKDDAHGLFNQIKTESEEEFSQPAAYFSGLINFTKKHYDLAIEDFKFIEGESIYGLEAPRWITSALLKQEKFTELLAYAGPLLKNPKTKIKLDDIGLMVGNLRFQREDFQEAYQVYQQLFARYPERITRLLSFKKAYSLYKIKNFNEAQREFGSIAFVKDSLGQHVEYNKGLVLEALELKDAAIKSFDLVKSVNFDPIVSQDAYLKKIGILNEQKKFTAALTEIDECNKRFPKGKNLNDLLKLRIFTVSNWGNLNAIEAYLKQAKGQNTDVQAIYQSLLYDKANRAYKSNNLTEALADFKKSLGYPISPEITAYAKYGQGEILAKTNRNPEAVKVYMNVLSDLSSSTDMDGLKQRIRLSLAQSFTYMAMYEKAQQYFVEYESNIKDLTAKYNTYLNLAEVSVAAGKLNEGIKYFDLASSISAENKFEIITRKASILYDLRKYKEASLEYEKLLKMGNSGEMADFNTYRYYDCLFRFQTNEAYAKVIKGLYDLINRPGLAPTILIKSLLIKGQSYENTGQFFAASDDYRRIVTEFPKDPAAKDAIVGLREMLTRTNRSLEFIAISEKFELANPEDEDNADRSFENVRLSFNSKRYKEVTLLGQKFLTKYPKDESVAQANYYVAESHFQLKNYSQSTDLYKKVLRSSVDSLHSSASTGIMKGYLKMDYLDSAATHFTQLLTKDSLILSTYTQEIAKGYELKGDKQKEIQWLNETIKFDSFAKGAQASLRLAAMMSADSKYKESIDFIKSNFVDKAGRFYDAEASIVGKAFLLLADNFANLKNIPQSKAILSSLVESSSDAEIRKLAKVKLQALK
jgi:tetratricopeptide (TPR) repeat protein